MLSEKPYKNQGQMEEIWSKMRKRAPKSLKKHWLEQLFATHCSNVKNLMKPMGQLLFEIAKTAFAQPYGNLGQVKGILSTMRKGAPRSLQKHWLEQHFATHFFKRQKPLPNQWKSHFSKRRRRDSQNLI